MRSSNHQQQQLKQQQQQQQHQQQQHQHQLYKLNQNLLSKPTISKPTLTLSTQEMVINNKKFKNQQEEESNPSISSSPNSSSTWLSIQANTTERSEQLTQSNNNNNNNNNNHTNQLIQLGNWAYSWINPLTDQLIQQETSLNPISDSIPTNSRAWSNYFSSRRSLPIHKLNQDNKSIESMSIQLSSSSQSHSDHQETNDSSKKAHRSTITSSSPSPSPSSHPIEPLTDNSPPRKLRSTSTSLKGKQKSASIPNLVLPTFEDTFHHPPRSFLPKPSKLQQTFDLVQAFIFSAPPQFPQTIAADALPSRRENSRKRRQASDILHHNQHISTRLPKALDLLRVDRLGKLRKLKTIAVIGIHGWFPGPWLESVLGKPTGTSTKFTTMMDDALRQYLQQALPDAIGLNPDFTTLIPLEGDGKVDDRVMLLFKELNKRQDWIDAIKSADAIFVVSHSQGCLVSCKLIEKLITSFKLPGDRFLSLAMCGIWNGPYVGLNNNYALQPVLKFFEGPAAHELFEFQNPHSPASKAVSKSLKNCLKLGVKYVLIGSMNDQVVPLYSSINHPVDHPSILRALFIDSAVFYSTDFLTNLVVFCLRLRNAGFSDHGLLFLLSDYLIGSLYGVGHSTLYEDPNVFSLAVRYFFESSSPLEPPTNIPQTGNVRSPSPVGDHESEPGPDDERVLPSSLMVIDQSLNPKDKPNPFLLTWSLRGLIEDHRIKLMFSPELSFLKASFLHWNPTSVPPPPLLPNHQSSSTSSSSASSPPPPQSAHSNSKILKDLKIKLEPFKEVQLD